MENTETQKIFKKGFISIFCLEISEWRPGQENERHQQ